MRNLVAKSYYNHSHWPWVMLSRPKMNFLRLKWLILFNFELDVIKIYERVKIECLLATSVNCQSCTSFLYWKRCPKNAAHFWIKIVQNGRCNLKLESIYRLRLCLLRVHKDKSLHENAAPSLLCVWVIAFALPIWNGDFSA